VEVFVISFVIIALAMTGMALGVIFGRSPLKGSCGGGDCGACPGRCRREADGGRTGEAT
jgi:hypothetical protein